MLRFFTELAGPIFAKEMVEVSRRKRYYVNRVLYGVALLIAVSIVWSESRWQYVRDNGGQLQAMARVAMEIFVAVGAVQYGAIFLLVPLFVAGLIAGEREANSLDLLFTTSLHDREIVLGKLGSRLAIMMLLVLCGVPVINLILLFGGVDPAAVIRTEAATLLGMLYAGSMTIYFSVVSKSPTAVLVRSFWWMAVWMVGLPILCLMTAELFRIRPNSPGAILVYSQVFINPLALFMMGLIPEAHQEVARWVGEWFFPLAFIPTLLWCGLLLWRSVARLRMQPTVLLKLASKWHPLAALMNAWRRRRENIDHRRRQRAERLWPGIPVRNPLWLRARWTPVYDRERHIGRVQWLGWIAASFFLLIIPFADARSGAEEARFVLIWLVAVGLAAATAWILVRRRASRSGVFATAFFVLLGALAVPLLAVQPRSWRDDELIMVFLIPTWIAAWLLTVILGATSLVGDRRRGFLELVLTSPLESREIVGGTMAAVAQHLVLVYGLAGILTCWFTLAGGISIIGACEILITGTLFGLLLLQLGVTCSLAAERPPAAMIPTFIFGVVMCAGLFILAVMIEEGIVVVWILACIFGPVTCWFWARKRESPAAIGSLFLFVHLALLLAIFALNIDYTSDRLYRRGEEVVAVATNPLTLIYCHVDRPELGRLGFGPLYVPCYWLALAINWWLAWKWTLKHFDRLAGRAIRQSVPRLHPRMPSTPHRPNVQAPIGTSDAAPVIATLISETTSTDST